MSDPAEAAAQQVWSVVSPNTNWQTIAEAAAREALKPIRELVENLKVDDFPEGVDLQAVYVFLDKLRPLIYSSEELERTK